MQINGTQYATGGAQRFIMVTEGGYEALTEMTCAGARELGRALIAAADEADKMAGYDQITAS